VEQLHNEDIKYILDGSKINLLLLIDGLLFFSLLIQLLSISWLPEILYVPSGLRFICNHTGEIISNLLVNFSAISYPLLFH
jgi:hypothetical protein